MESIGCDLLFQYGNIPESLTITCFDNDIYYDIVNTIKSYSNIAEDFVFFVKDNEESGGYILIRIDREILNKGKGNIINRYLKEIVLPLLKDKDYVMSLPFY